jgi:uncharacterized integral membrane protein (TIGR00698 family)
MRADVRRSNAMALVPGLAIAAAGVAVAFALHNAVSDVSELVAAVAIGVVLANVGAVPNAARPGLRFAARRILRAGIVLLGFRLAIGDVAKLGTSGIVIVVAVVTVTFLGTQFAGRRLGLSSALSLLVATGFSICGASAIAAMEGVADADEEEVAYAIALVTICGSLSILLLPALQSPLGLATAPFGSWVGASVHDVGQVVATASHAGPVAVEAAVVVKLTRVVLLAPLVAGVSIQRRRGAAAPGLPLVPLFVVGFLAAVAVRSTGVLSHGMLSTLNTATTIALASALVGLGADVRLASLRRVGIRPLALGLVSWVIVAAIAYIGVVLTT